MPNSPDLSPGLADRLISAQSTPYFGNELRSFRAHFLPTHGVLSLCVCVFGIGANLLTILVLSRKQMLSATNTILTGLAVADLLVMLTYAPYSFHTFVRPSTDEQVQYSYGWALFTFFHANSSAVFHTVSIWLTVLLAIFRYKALRCFQQHNQWLSVRRARLAVLIVYAACPCFCLPALFTFAIKPRDQRPSEWPSTVFFPPASTEQLAHQLQWIDWWLKSNGSLPFNGLSAAESTTDLEEWLAEQQQIHAYIGLVGQPSEPLPSHTFDNISQYFQSSAPTVTYRVTFSEVATAHDQLLNRLNFWIYSVLTKLVPCLALTFLSIVLIRLLCQANYRRGRLLCNQTTLPATSVPFNGSQNTLLTHDWRRIGDGRRPSYPPIHSFHSSTSHGGSAPEVLLLTDLSSTSDATHNFRNCGSTTGIAMTTTTTPTPHACDRSTRMLICILVLFLLTEFPSGLLGLFAGILGEPFFHNVYHNLGEAMDLMALVNSGINFLLYCSMSSKFRKTFGDTFFRPRRPAPVSRATKNQRKNPLALLSPRPLQPTATVVSGAGPAHDSVVETSSTPMSKEHESNTMEPSVCFEDSQGHSSLGGAQLRPGQPPGKASINKRNDNGNGGQLAQTNVSGNHNLTLNLADSANEVNEDEKSLRRAKHVIGRFRQHHDSRKKRRNAQDERLSANTDRPFP